MTKPFSRRLALGGIASTFILLVPGQGNAQANAQGSVQSSPRGGFEAVHAQGRTMLPATPRRVAVFDLAALDILQALGVDVAGVPDAAFPAYLAGDGGARYSKVAKVGSLFEPDYGALSAVRPDLIVVASRSSAKFAELSRIAPTIDLSTSTTAFVPSVARNILLLGRIFGRQAEAAALTEQLLADAQALQAKGAKAGTGLLLFVAGQGISPQPAQTRFGVFYELAGIAPAITAADLPPARPRAARQPDPVAGSPEAAAADEARKRQSAQQAARLAALLAQRDPDWLFVLDRNAATGGQPVAEKLLAGNAAVMKTKAWAKRQVVYLDAPTWYLVGGGATALKSGIAQIDAAFTASASAGQGSSKAG